jgi:hypothetical protein
LGAAHHVHHDEAHFHDTLAEYRIRLLSGVVCSIAKSSTEAHAL